METEAEQHVYVYLQIGNCTLAFNDRQVKGNTSPDPVTVQLKKRSRRQPPIIKRIEQPLEQL